MTYDKMLLRFGEVGLKGKNRAFFIRALAANVRRSLKPLGQDFRVSTPYGRIFIDLPGDCDTGAVVDALGKVFGLVSFSPVVQTELTLEAIAHAARQELQADGLPKTFKVAARRSLKTFPLDSMELNRELGGILLQSFPG